jgi:hypothetical protein
MSILLNGAEYKRQSCNGSSSDVWRVSMAIGRGEKLRKEIACRNFLEENGHKIVVNGITGFSKWKGVRIAIPKSIEQIQDHCFLDCFAFYEIVFEWSSKLKRIGEKSFSGCSLELIRIPKSCQDIGSRCFSSLKSICSITFESGSMLKVIGDSSFADSNIKSIQIPNRVERIERNAFSGCRLSEISFDRDSKLKEIAGNAFELELASRYFYPTKYRYWYHDRVPVPVPVPAR